MLELFEIWVLSELLLLLNIMFMAEWRFARPVKHIFGLKSEDGI